MQIERNLSEGDTVISDITQKCVSTTGILDENDPDNARFMILIRDAMEELQRQVGTERSMYHKSREELARVERDNRILQSELSLERERNNHMKSELDKLENAMNECNNEFKDEGEKYWNLYKEALDKIDTLERNQELDPRIEALGNEVKQLEEKLEIERSIAESYKQDNQRLDQELKNMTFEFQSKLQDLTEKFDIEKIENESIITQYNELAKKLESIEVDLKTYNCSSMTEFVEILKSRESDIIMWRTKAETLENSNNLNNDREISLHEKEVIIATKEGYLEGKEVALSQLETKLQSQELLLNERSNELDMKLSQVLQAEKDVEGERLVLRERNTELEIREREAIRLDEELKSREKAQQLQSINFETQKFELNKLEHHLETRQQELDECRMELLTLRDEVEARQLQINEQVKDLSYREDNLNKLRDELETNRRLQSEESVDNSKYEEDYKIRKAELEAEYESQKNRLEDFQSLLQSRQQAIDKEKKVIDERYKHLTQKEEQIEKLKILVDSQKSELNIRQQEFDEYIRELESRQKEFESFWHELDRRQKNITIREHELDERQALLDNHEISLNNQEKQSLIEKEIALVNREQIIYTRETSLNSKEKSLLEKEDSLRCMEVNIADKKSVLNEQEVLIGNREIKLSEREASLNTRDIMLKNKEMSINNKEIFLTDKETSFSKKELELNEQENKLKIKEATLAEEELVLTNRLAHCKECESTLSQKEKILLEKEVDLRNHELQLNEKQKQVLLERKSITDEISKIKEKEELIYDKESQIKKLEHELFGMEATIKLREKEVEELKQFIQHLESEKIENEKLEHELFGMEATIKLREKEVEELKQFIQHLESEKIENERQIRKTYDSLKQQVQEEMKQKEDLLYTVLHLHKQINDMSTCMKETSNTAKIVNDVAVTAGIKEENNITVSPGNKKKVGNRSYNGKVYVDQNKDENASNNFVETLEKAMQRFYEKLQTIEDREESLLKELENLSDKNGRYLNSNRGEDKKDESVETDSIELCNSLDANLSVSAYSTANGQTSQLAAQILPGSQPTPAVITQVPSNQLSTVTQVTNQQVASVAQVPIATPVPTTPCTTVPMVVQASIPTTSPLLYPDSPLLLMPLLTDIKNDISELKKTSNTLSVVPTLTDNLSKVDLSSDSNMVGVLTRNSNVLTNINVDNNNGPLISSSQGVNSSSVYSGNCSINESQPKQFDSMQRNGQNNSLVNHNSGGSLNFQIGHCDDNSVYNGNLVNQSSAALNSILGSSLHQHPFQNSQLNDHSSYYPFIGNNNNSAVRVSNQANNVLYRHPNYVRPSSGSASSSASLNNRESARKLLESELQSLRRWKKGMQQWDSEIMSQAKREDDASSWKQFLDNQMKFIAKKLERRLSDALQK